MAPGSAGGSWVGSAASTCTETPPSPPRFAAGWAPGLPGFPVCGVVREWEGVSARRVSARKVSLDGCSAFCPGHGGVAVLRLPPRDPCGTWLCLSIPFC